MAWYEPSLLTLLSIEIKMKIHESSKVRVLFRKLFWMLITFKKLKKNFYVYPIKWAIVEKVVKNSIQS